ncbi:SusC/RagA family TonB-linked outer membrane protein [Pontibacter virosus]|uniref:Iron complex outermembrane receptor protein n=1 Tax=Pontibacter virosus TaxID=1765052 RepID=A0A2U1AQN9_9BACT|nr:SusC/RagA family TonB-linked outer membrane protein [Pontibacter virosus]PVY38716.1 iron complex outermembrane receptor protein [Pontibacter virosus]
MKQILPQPIKFLRYSCVAFGLYITTSAASLGQNQPFADSTRFAADTVQFTYKPYELSAADFNKGLVTSVEPAIIGRFDGLRVVSGGGAPGTGAEMVLRSGTSLFGNNSPLVIIDGVLLDFFSHSLHASNLSWLNPNDIAAVSLLKDASATALYGGAAANGVLVITTKSGNAGDKIRLQYNATGAVSSLRKRADIFSADEFRILIRERYPNQQHLLGEHNTDWQDEIYRTGFGLANNLNVSGAMGPVPYRVSVGQLKQDGILKTSGYKRNTLAVNLQPSLFQKHLTFNLSMHNTRQELQLADERAIPAVMAFDPTQPVHADNKYGGYFAHTRPDGSLLSSQINPVSLLEQMENSDEIKTLSGQAHVQYRLHFLPAFTANYRYAYFKSDSDYSSSWPLDMASRPSSHIDLIKHALESETKHSEVFITLDQLLPAWSSKLNLKVGALKTYQENLSQYEESQRSSILYTRAQNRQLISENLSYYGSFGYTLFDRYTLSASFRNLSDSRYKEDVFRHQSKAVSIGWDIVKERFLANSEFIALLNLRANLGSFSRLDEPGRFRSIGWSPVQGSPTPGGSNWYVFPGPSNEIKLEKTLQKSLGVEFALFQNKILGSINYFQNKSSDLLIPFRLPYGSGNGLRHLSVGDLTASGLETALHYTIYQKGIAFLKLGAHATFIRNEVGSIGDATKKYTYSDSDYGLALVEGKPAQVFDLYQHLYDGDGKPIQGGYDKSEYGYALKYAMGTNQPKVYYGISSNGGYRKWEMSLLVRGSARQQVYNQADAKRSWLYANDKYPSLSNATRSYLENGFISSHLESSHFLEDASFLRLEYVQFGYNVGKLLGNKVNLKVNATVQNAFILTKYSGQDPEVSNGIDRGQYPQPRTFSLGLNLSI